MARPPASRALGGSWQWGRTAQTQRALLDAAGNLTGVTFAGLPLFL